jgi:hypothetical protein
MPRVRPGKFVFSDAKRLLQQNPPMNGHRQFDWVASRNIGRQLGRAVNIPGCASERTGRQPVAPMAPTLILDSCCGPDGFLLHRSRASLRWPQCVSFRDGSNTRSTCRFRALITPMRANIVGPPDVADPLDDRSGRIPYRPDRNGLYARTEADDVYV